MIYVFYITLFLFIFAHGLYYYNLDGDFFARLIVGKTFFQTASVLNWDFLSYTPTHRFIDHEWGSSLVFYFLQSHFGDWGLLIFKGVIYFATFFLLTKVILLHNKEAKLRFLPFLIIINIIPGILFATVRCQSFSFFFFALWLYTLERVRLENNNRLLWILPATMLVWGNMHGGCAAGIGLLVIYVIGEFLNGKPVKKYVITLILSIAVLFINPYGVEYLKFLFSALTLKRDLIVEWQSAFSPTGLEQQYKFAIFLILCPILFAIYAFKFRQNYKDIDKTKALLLVITYLLAIKSIRLQAFFAFSLLAFCYSDFYKLFSKKLPKSIDEMKEIVLFGIIVIFAICAVAITRMQCFAWNFPIMEVEFLKANKVKGNIMCLFQDGSYIAYKLYPNNLIFMDGRYEEVYQDNLVYVEQVINAGHKDWKEYLNIYPADILIVPKEYRFFENLTKDKDEDFLMLMNSPYYALFIRKELADKNFKTPSGKASYYMETKYDTNIDWSVDEN